MSPTNPAQHTSRVPSAFTVFFKVAFELRKNAGVRDDLYTNGLGLILSIF